MLNKDTSNNPSANNHVLMYGFMAIFATIAIVLVKLFDSQKKDKK